MQSSASLIEPNFSKNSPNVFEKRVNIKPEEYPDLLKYKEAIRHSYWVHTEYNYDPDIQDIHVNLTPNEREAICRTMLAISQIENKVKKFWGDIENHLPKPEISDVGVTFAESEVRHKDAYAELLSLLGLNQEFEKLDQIPAMKDRIKYINKVNSQAALAEDPKAYFKSIIFFSILIENVSLFSQFYIIMAFNKFKNVLKGMSNAVEATSKEEDLHANFGFDLINIIKSENPEWWTEDLILLIRDQARKAFLAEQKVLDWIYENEDISVAPRAVVEEFIKHRINTSLNAIGITGIFFLDPNIVKQFEWFEDEVTVTKQSDFFQKRNITYTKKNKSISEEDLF